MSEREFEKHITDKAPAFRCYACGDREERLTFTAKITNDLNPPASKKALAEIESLLGVAGKPFKQLYGLHNGMALYRDLKSDAAGVQFYAVEEWSARSEVTREELRAMGCDEDAMPAWLKEGIAFGEIPHSANFFVVGVGDVAGKIFYADHDDFNDSPMTEDLAELLDKIRTDPAAFLYERGCYTRYSDGKTNTQWIPKQYVSDVGG